MAVNMVLKQIKVMRRKFTYPVFPVLFLALALAGCQREPVPAAGDTIRFSVNSVGIAPAPTKADPVIPTVPAPETQLTQSGSKVIVWASLNTATPENWKPVFDDPSIVLENAGGSWTYSGEKYWNRDAEYKFKSVYPDDASIQSGSNIDLVTVNYAGIAQDLMVASYSLTKSQVKSAKTVDLAFSHTCSAVRVYIVDPDRGDQAVRYQITGLKLQDLYMAGTLAYDWYKFLWTPSGDRTTGYSWPETAGSKWPVPATYTAFTDWLFFVPQALNPDTGEKPCISLKFTIGDQTIPFTKNLEDLNSSWEPGYMYTYFIKIRPKGIEITVEWTDWGTAEHDYGTIG